MAMLLLMKSVHSSIYKIVKKNLKFKYIQINFGGGFKQISKVLLKNIQHTIDRTCLKSNYIWAKIPLYKE